MKYEYRYRQLKSVNYEFSELDVMEALKDRILKLAPQSVHSKAEWTVDWSDEEGKLTVFLVATIVEKQETRGGE